MLPGFDLGWIGTFEEELDGFLQISRRLLNVRPLAGNVELGAECHVEISLFLEDRGEAGLRHGNFPPGGEHRTLCLLLSPRASRSAAGGGARSAVGGTRPLQPLVSGSSG